MVIGTALCEPQDGFMATAEALATVKAMPKSPNNSVSKSEFWNFAHDVVDQKFQRNKLVSLNKISNLPTHASPGAREPGYLREHLAVRRDEGCYVAIRFV